MLFCSFMAFLFGANEEFFLLIIFPKRKVDCPNVLDLLTMYINDVFMFRVFSALFRKSSSVSHYVNCVARLRKTTPKFVLRVE